ADGGRMRVGEGFVMVAQKRDLRPIPAEPPATGTLAGSALSAAAKSFAFLKGDCAGTTSARNSPVKRAIGVACASLTGLLLAMIAPTITMPATISALPCPFH